MILQKLHDLYSHLEKDDSYDIAPEGYSNVSISFIIELEKDGSFKLLDHRQGEGNRRHGRPMIVPGPAAHTNEIEAFPYRDTATYLLGYHQGSGIAENTRKRFEESKKFHAELAKSIITEEAIAVACFFEKLGSNEWKPDDPKILTNSGVFRLRGNLQFVHESPKIISWWKTQIERKEESGEARFCLITGKYLPVALIHSPAIGGNMPGPAQAKAPIVAFNKGRGAFESYGNNNDQGLNAPVSEEAATKYCKALNALLSDESRRHRLQIGDATTVFWTETPTASLFSLTRFFSGESPPEDNEAKAQDNILLDAIQSQTKAIRQGIPPHTILPDSQIPYHILGLTGQAGGRIGIRFHHTATLGQLIEKLAQHHNDLSINRPVKNGQDEFIGNRYPSIKKLLEQTGRESKNQPPALAGSLIRSILSGTPYPNALPLLVIARIRADRHIDPYIQKDKALDTYIAREQAYLRAAILKAFLNRNHFNKTNSNKMTEALDPTRIEPAYHLGRLFAVYETAQKHAHDWKLERTIRETMYSSASATPLAVFGRLERLHHHHTAKKSHPPGSSDSYADIVGEIEQHFKGSTPIYPASLGLIDQSLFAVGYYHQLQHFKHLSNLKKETTASNS
jgi:CRISPR-associated protein Csd1